jgi:tripartite-type tricarboxylate transporter receptor subunit TctC
VVARTVGTKVSETWKQPVIIENHPGGGGIIGNDIVAKAPPDGYAVLFASTQLIQAPAMGMKLPYDVLKDFIPVTQCEVNPLLLAVPASSPANSVSEFVVMTKSNPGKYNYGSFGTGTTSHIFGELLKISTGADLAHIPFRGAALLLNDVLAGHVESAFVDILTGIGQVKAGAIKALAVTGVTRSRLLPSVPTFAELGYAGFEPLGWMAAFVPAGTPKAIVNKLSDEIGRIMRLPDVTARIYDLGGEPVGNTAEEFAVVLKADYEKWTNIIRHTNIKAE